jgi:hypothetical protein
MIALNISLFVLLILLIILAVMGNQSMAEMFVPDQAIPDNSPKSRDTQMYRQFEDKKLLSPFDYQNYKSTVDYDKYFNKPGELEIARPDLEGVQMGFTPDHDPYIGSTTIPDMLTFE